VFSSLEDGLAPEPLDTTVERAGRLWWTRMTLRSGARGPEVDLRIVSLDSPDERCVLTVSERDMVVSRRFLWRELLAEGGRT
jgi:hypothetical protein